MSEIVDVNCEIEVKAKCSNCNDELECDAVDSGCRNVCISVKPCSKCSSKSFGIESELYHSLCEEMERKHGRELRNEIEMFCQFYIPKAR